MTDFDIYNDDHIKQIITRLVSDYAYKTGINQEITRVDELYEIVRTAVHNSQYISSWTGSRTYRICSLGDTPRDLCTYVLTRFFNTFGFDWF